MTAPEPTDPLTSRLHTGGMLVFTLLAAGALAAACGGSAADSRDGASRQDAGQPPPPGEEPLITVDRESYQPRRTADGIELDIVSTFTNRTADTVYLHPCGRASQPAFMLEKWESGAWRPAYSPPCPAILMLDPPPVAPGATRTDTARVRASTAPGTMPRFEMDPVTGTYRLVYAQAYGSWRAGEGPGDLLPLERRVSGAFRIEE